MKLGNFVNQRPSRAVSECFDLRATQFLCLVSYRAAFGAVVVDDGARMFVESIQPLADGFLVVVDASGGQTAAQKSLGHRLVADFEVKHQSARIDLGLELDSLSHFTRVSVDQETLGRGQFLEHFQFDQIQDRFLHQQNELLNSTGKFGFNNSTREKCNL